MLPLLPLFLLVLFQEEEAVGRAPPRLLHNFSSGRKGLAAHREGEPGLLIFAGRQEHRQKSPDHQIIDVPLRTGQTEELRLLLGGEDGVVISDPGVVDQEPGLKRPLHEDGPGQVPIFVHHDALEPLGKCAHHIVGDIPGVGAGIGEQLVPLIQGLHQREGLLGGVGVFPVGVPLQLRKVIGRRGRRLPEGPLHLAEHAMLSLEGGAEVLRPFPVEGPGLSVPVPPGGREPPALRLHGEILLRDKAPDLLLPVHNQGQGRGLDAPGGELGPVLTGERPSDVEPHQPVGLAAGAGRVEKIVIFSRRAQMGKAVPDGLVGLGGYPQPLGGLVPSRFLHDPPGHQFPLPAGIGGDDQFLHVPPAHQGLDRAELPPGLLDNRGLHVLRQHGQGQQVPFLPGLVVGLRRGQLHQVAQGPGHDIPFPLQTALSPTPASQYAGELLSYRRLFRQHQRLCHAKTPCFSSLAPLYWKNREKTIASLSQTPFPNRFLL